MKMNRTIFNMVLLANIKSMDPVRDPKFEKDLFTGLISLILLAICARSREPLYGYQIARRMEGDDPALPKLKQGTIYPVLRSLEKNGFLKSMIKASESGPPRKYYTITDKGRKKLDVWVKTWRRTRLFVDGVLEGDENA
jgi:PadR family transcriptional regulator PadR